VTLSLYREKNRVCVGVADTGIGMPADQIEKVFTKFFRAENAQLYQTSGTGLGLYLAQNIVEHHGGVMFFKTEENKGSTFTFSLPIPKPGIKKV
jgi:signal transduction histidine kinase